jgi:YidC/Oxa1 family membrane protein insertase
MSNYLANNFGLAIIGLTIIVNLAMLPLTLKQIRASKAMQDLQPKLTELQKKYAKDKQKLAKEQIGLYKQSGVSPAGCLLPMLIQMPIWFALYQSIMMAMAVAPEGLLNLSRYLYSWPIVYSTIPLSKDFLWLNLASPDIFLAILVGATMWLQQKMATPITSDPKQQAQSRITLWMLPLMFSFLALSFPSGLALYWVTSSIVRIIIQYRVTGWGGRFRPTTWRPVVKDKYKRRIAQVEEMSSETSIRADIVETSPESEEGLGDEKPGDKSQDRGRGYQESLKEIKRQARRNRSHRPKRR